MYNNEKKLQLGFLGVGWIGCNRMEALLKTGLADAVVIADISDENARNAQSLAPHAKIVHSIEEMCDEKMDAIVIATPSGQHFSQVMTAFENDLHVFCQKPLARTKDENVIIVNKAKSKDKVLWVDFSYRYTQAMQMIKEMIGSGEIGDIYAIDAIFHNAYGPDKAWFFDPEKSGGGCVIDLGIHLIDLALWISDFPDVEKVNSALYSKGKRIYQRKQGVEDYASAIINLDNGVVVNAACSWNLSAGKDAVIEFTVYGTDGALSMKNHNGSFYEFHAYHLRSRNSIEICKEQGSWGGKAIIDWAQMVVHPGKYDTRSEQLSKVAGVIDLIYDRDKQ